MAYCKKCGAYIPDGDVVCPACGTGTSESGAQTAAQTEEKKKSEYRDSGEYHSGSYSGTYYNRTSPGGGSTSGEYHSGEYHGGAYSSGYNGMGGSPGMYSNEYDADALANKGMGYLCYLGILFLIPYFTRPNSQFLRYHCNQGLVLLLFCILVSICSNIPILGWIAGFAGSIFAFYCLIKGLGNVAKGKRSPLPLIGDITIIQ